PPTHRKSKVAELSGHYPINIRRALNDAYEKIVTIEFIKERPHLCFSESAFHFHINRCEDPARYRQGMRHENEIAGPISNVGQFLFNLGNMLMCEWLVGIKRIAALRMMRICGGFGARA